MKLEDIVKCIKKVGMRAFCYTINKCELDFGKAYNLIDWSLIPKTYEHEIEDRKADVQYAFKVLKKRMFNLEEVVNSIKTGNFIISINREVGVCIYYVDKPVALMSKEPVYYKYA